MSRTARLLGGLALALAMLVLAGCGEKPEPDLQALPAEPQPAPLGEMLEALAAQGASAPDPIAGTWHGRLRQAGMKPFSIRVTIASLSDPKLNVVRYGPPIDCAGTWRFQSGRDGTARFVELIDRGAGNRCKGRGTVSLQLVDGGRLDYRFEGGGVSSRGRLSRSGTADAQ